ncbi:dipeptidyl peptidase 9 [Schistocerca piceifrons]|uniref:dipeptidyl peptidase 9 n=1 Tax=Schistocerca piceifrons TaxID=274613 RepID=UPI001F5E8157|nr:dipeptidyl peptidase 9 [Schistocerca piceifrons]XP_047119037.1 dipeptidyl peptidase 9 [Schistocerca piceifrons]XP_049780779.1 dipeptidyl peptidase 9 [Schistocerca cancellata]XP_049780780.1 dipeptidyl peptidase 9 [Schistocerca cancellata]XP_049780781.1 dipeptidyl peptidase 9 [Schistocerca cancellata]XP_049812889.1 dipeptidyl peptidase 9 [Schistocerca nitens]XP_049812896.1 dipeptidyl peptidase 9 [Schistocerca nitens]XP_049812906.1 dipeptidyl peptidase 9 [Schistocerca nitens]
MSSSGAGDLDVLETAGNTVRSGPPRSWARLRTVVHELRRQLSSLSTAVPSQISFRPLPDGRTRIYFLGTPKRGWETALLYADAGPGPGPPPGPYALPWQHAVEGGFPRGIATGAGRSREEQLLWERRRLASFGVASYELHPASGKIIFPAGGSLFQCLDTGFSNGPLFPSELRMNPCGAKLNPMICPTNPDLVAYVCHSDIWVTHAVTGATNRLTFAHKGGRTLAEDPLSAGIPSYVMQEEFSRYQGYWWQPKTTDGIYRIAYEEVDESDVKIYCFPSSTSHLGDFEEYRFPRAGTANSKSNLKMVQFKVNENHQIYDVNVLELQYPLCVLFPWMEYLVRVGWTPSGDYVWAQLLDRRQQRLELVLLSVDNFLEPPPNVYSIDKPPAAPSPAVRVIYTQHSDIWINVNELLYFFPTNEDSEVRFIWASEETGFRHLYFITAHVSGVSNGIDDALDTIENTFLQARVSQKIALTSGDWEVLGRSIWVDPDRQLVYFLGLRESPLEKHLYVVSLRRPDEVRLLTRPGYSYTVDFNKECTMLVAVYSNIQKLPACQVFRISHTDWTVEGVTLTPVGYLLEPSVPEANFHYPELYTHKISSGDLLYAMVFRPHNFEPGVKYPTVLNIYGGPEVQLVSNTFKGMRQLRMHMLASQGYCVVAVDSRGSQHRGLLFESHLKGRMGTVELADQIEVLLWLADTLGYIDTSRIAIHGWSYGGYLSLMGLAQHPDIFKVAIAGAPVTSWALYDTGYTERYMDLPENNQQGYKQGSILTYVNQFPDEENRLLIIHGLIDENVHFFHTSQLISAMIKAGKPYQLQVYPNERHSLRDLDASKHYETMLLSFLENYL